MVDVLFVGQNTWHHDLMCVFPCVARVQLHSEAVELYRSKGMHEEALDLLKSYVSPHFNLPLLLLLLLFLFVATLLILSGSTQTVIGKVGCKAERHGSHGLISVAHASAVGGGYKAADEACGLAAEHRTGGRIDGARRCFTGRRLLM